MVYCGNTARVTIGVHNLARIFLRNKLQARIINDSFKHPARVLQTMQSGLQACCEHILLTSCEIFTCVPEKMGNI
jgi:hypothetical protein